MLKEHLCLLLFLSVRTRFKDYDLYFCKIELDFGINAAFLKNCVTKLWCSVILLCLVEKSPDLLVISLAYYFCHSNLLPAWHEYPIYAFLVL